jgi:hypothetical protein
MQIYSLRNFNSRLAHARREYIVRDYLVNTQWRKNGIITALDNAAASRIDQVPQAPKCYPPCGKNTISVELTISNRNLLGPHHRPDAAVRSPGPGEFEPSVKRENWRGDRYSFIAAGLGR